MTPLRLIRTNVAAPLVFACAFLCAAPDLRAQAREIKEPLPASVDLPTVQLIEIRNDAGVTVLSGTFSPKDNEKNDVERKVKLSGVSGTGSAEIEFSRKDGQLKEQELEVELERLLYGAAYKIFLEKKEVFAFSADDKGKARLKLSSKITK